MTSRLARGERRYAQASGVSTHFGLENQVNTLLLYQVFT
jgi:hypothetical protein